MPSNDAFIVGVLAFLVMMSAYFSATETAFSTLNRIRIKTMAEKGHKGAKLVLNLSEKYDSLISTILVGNNIVNIGMASIATVLFIRLIGQDLGATISTIVITVIVLVFGEITPKTLAKESPEKFALFSAPIIYALMFVFYPINWLFKQWKKLLNLVFKHHEERTITEEELLTIVDEAEEGGEINKTEGSLIRSVIEFSELEVVDIYTPRVDVIAVNKLASNEEVAKVFFDTNFSRLPVYEKNMDHIVGVINQKDFHNLVNHTEKTIEAIIKPAYFVSRSKKIDGLMKELQLNKVHLAIVVDEFGGTSGIITLEDILEELVGEIWDEHDDVINDIEQIGEDEYLVYGNTNVEKFFDFLDREQEFEILTMSGWVMSELGHIPHENEEFTAEGLHVIVTKMNGKRISRLKIQVLQKQTEKQDNKDE